MTSAGASRGPGLSHFLLFEIEAGRKREGHVTTGDDSSITAGWGQHVSNNK